MAGPTGVLTYLDYVYAGGKLQNAGEDQKTKIIKMEVGSITSGSKFAVGEECTVVRVGATSAVASLIFIGYGRLDSKPIFRINDSLLPLDVASLKKCIYSYSIWTFCNNNRNRNIS